MNRDDLKELSVIRLEEVEFLLQNGKYDGAYYLCGYIIEYAIKACIAKRINQYDFPDKVTTQNAYSHSFTGLINAAKLEPQLRIELRSNSIFASMWNVVIDWKPDSRYEKNSEIKANELYQSITDKTNGVLRWIQLHW